MALCLHLIKVVIRAIEPVAVFQTERVLPHLSLIIVFKEVVKMLSLLLSHLLEIREEFGILSTSICPSFDAEPGFG